MPLVLQPARTLHPGGLLQTLSFRATGSRPARGLPSSAALMDRARDIPFRLVCRSPFEGLLTEQLRRHFSEHPQTIIYEIDRLGPVRPRY
jgi:hypothetical protein